MPKRIAGSGLRSLFAWAKVAEFVYSVAGVAAAAEVGRGRVKIPEQASSMPLAIRQENDELSDGCGIERIARCCEYPREEGRVKILISGS